MGTQFTNLGTDDGGTWMRIPMSADGSTSQDVSFQMNGGKPELYFNNAGSHVSDNARIRVGTGGLTLQTEGTGGSDANIRLQASGAVAITTNDGTTISGTLGVTGATTVSGTLGVTGASTLDGVTITDNTISTTVSYTHLTQPTISSV